jgi:hypothetical protein
MTQKMATSQTTSLIQAAQPTIKLLESLDPKAFLLRLRCEAPGCNKTFTHDVAFVLRMTRSSGFFIPSKLCRKCRKKTKGVSDRRSSIKKPKKTEALKPLPPKVKEAPVPKPVKKERVRVEKPEPVPVSVDVDDDRMTHRPFEALKNLIPPKPDELTPAQKGALTRKRNLELIEQWVTAKLKGNDLPELDPKLVRRAMEKFDTATKAKN